jgi:hypothetical protein
MLTRTNYQEWAMLMHVNYEVARWWYALEPKEGEEINYRHNQLALAAILRSVPPDMLSSLRERRSSAAAAWEAIKWIRIGVHLHIKDEPTTFTEAERHQLWRRAMLEEINSIKSNKTWRRVLLPPGHRPIGLKWVYKLKKNVVSNVVKHKERLVAKGYVQQQGVYFNEVFAHVARIESVRLLLALATQEGLSTTWT